MASLFAVAVAAWDWVPSGSDYRNGQTNRALRFLYLVPRRVHAFISKPVPEVRQASVTVSDPMIMRNDQIAVSVVKPEEKPRTFERVEASSDSLISQARTLGDFPDLAPSTYPCRRHPAEGTAGALGQPT